MNENAINEWNIKICLKQLMKLYKKEKLIETKLFILKKFIISKINKKNICVTRMRYEDQTHMHNSQPLPNHHTVVGETPHTSQF